MSATLDEQILAKNELTIAFVPNGQGGGFIEVRDSDGKGGGNVRARGGNTIRWTNETGYRCELRFLEFLAADDNGEPMASWPFRKRPPSGDNTAMMAAAGSNEERTFRGTLRKGIGGYVKYDVVIYSAGDVVLARLDPIIIIDH